MNWLIPQTFPDFCIVAVCALIFLALVAAVGWRLGRAQGRRIAIERLHRATNRAYQLGLADARRRSDRDLADWWKN